MKKLVLFALVAVVASLGVSQSASAQARRSGRDAFGYTWLRNDTAGGPTYNWIDIRTTGTRVTGMGDDMVAGPFNIGFDFKYFWNSYNQLYVGSNGYLMFGNGDNIASGDFAGIGSGMPPIPYQDNKNNFIAPFMADLTFIRSNGQPAGNAGLYYQQQGSKFIVTFDQVAFWNQATAGQVSGSMTFQVILDGADSSITMQYQSMAGVPFSGYTGIKYTLGYEDINGLNGSSFGAFIRNPNPLLLSGFANRAYKISYPRNSTFQILDVAADGVFNSDNGAQFFPLGGTNNVVSAVVHNAGTVDVTAPFNVSISVEDPSGTVVASGNVPVNSLARSQRATVSLPALPANAQAGTYLVQVTTDVANDGVAANNNRAGMLKIIDTAASPVIYTFGQGAYGDNQRFAGDDFGNYIPFASSPTRLTGVFFDMGWVDPTTDYQDSSQYRFYVYRESATPNVPGDVIDSVEIDWNRQFDYDSIAPLNLNIANIGPIRRHVLYFNQPYSVAGNGVYVRSRYIGPPRRFFWNRVMADTVAPYSYRGYEVQGGVWGPDRNRSEINYSLGVVTRTIITANRATLPREQVSTFPNPVVDQVTVRLPKSADRLVVLNTQGQVVATVDRRAIRGNNATFSVSHLQPGAYVIKGFAGGKAFSSRFVKI